MLIVAGSVKYLGFPDQHYVNSALGWLELGNHLEAKADADKISLLGRIHHEAFLVRWKIAARQPSWEEAYRLCLVYSRVAPKQPVGWICLSYSLYRLRRPLEAWMELLPKMKDFPKIGAIPYILACYAKEMGNNKLTEYYLAKSKALGGPDEVRRPALENTEFYPLGSTFVPTPPEVTENPPLTRLPRT